MCNRQLLTVAGRKFIGGGTDEPGNEHVYGFLVVLPRVGPGTTVFDVLRATEFVVPALEILDSRIEMEGRSIVDTISDNAACGAVVVGGIPMPISAIDLRWSGAILYRNQTIEETGLAAAVLNNPAIGVAWLANKLSRHGASLAAGDLILAGSFIRPTWAQVGDTFYADYGPLGTVTCRFA
jgi:2-oxo-hept-3-ene-1,7-dioate hydratase